MKLTKSILVIMLLATSLFSEAGEAVTSQSRSVEVANGRVIGEQTIRFIKGGTGEIHWQTDESMVVHFHGYDIEKRIKPDSIVLMSFDLYATGRFPVTVHAHNHSNNKSEQTLLYVEVHPQ